MLIGTFRNLGILFSWPNVCTGYGVTPRFNVLAFSWVARLMAQVPGLTSDSILFFSLLCSIEPRGLPNRELALSIVDSRDFMAEAFYLYQLFEVWTIRYLT